MDLLGPFGLTLALCGCAIIGLPFLDPKDDRARTALFAICIIQTWRYILWRFTDTLPPLSLRFESLYAWGFSLTEALACLGWTFGFINLSRTKSRSDEATRQRSWLLGSKHLPRIDVLITTYNEEERILLRSMIGALGIDFPGVRVWVLDDGRRPWLEGLCKPPPASMSAKDRNCSPYSTARRSLSRPRSPSAITTSCDWEIRYDSEFPAATANTVARSVSLA